MSLFSGSSPAQASTAPVTQEQEKSKLLSGRQTRRTNSVNSSAEAKAPPEAPASVAVKMKQPVLRLERLSEEVTSSSIRQ